LKKNKNNPFVVVINDINFEKGTIILKLDNIDN
jgi:hypothetical protein